MGVIRSRAEEVGSRSRSPSVCGCGDVRGGLGGKGTSGIMATMVMGIVAVIAPTMGMAPSPMVITSVGDSRSAIPGPKGGVVYGLSKDSRPRGFPRLAKRRARSGTLAGWPIWAARLSSRGYVGSLEPEGGVLFRLVVRFIPTVTVIRIQAMGSVTGAPLSSPGGRMGDPRRTLLLLVNLSRRGRLSSRRSS